MKNFPRILLIYTVKRYYIVNEAEVDVFLEFSYFFCDPTDDGSLISGSSALSKYSFYIWKFLERLEYQVTFPASWETCVQVKKQQL